MPLVSVSEMARFALPGGATLLAGARGLGSAVAWARLVRARPTSLGRVEQGEVWLLSPGALQQAGDQRSVARLIADLASAGVVAFVVGERLPTAALEEANARAVPILLLPPEASMAEVEKAIVSVVVDRDRAIGQRVQEVYDRLLATLVEDRGPELLAAIVHEVTGRAVYLLDEHFQALVQVGGDESSAQGLADVRRRSWEGNLGNVTERLVSVWSGSSDAMVAAVLRPLTLRGAVEGYLALLGARDDLGDFEHQIADRAASVLAIELAKQSAAVEARLRIQGDFLQDLLDTDAPVTEELVSRARRLGYDFASPHLVFVVRPRPEPLSAERNGADRTPTGVGQRGHQRFVDVARRRLILANPATLLREREGAIHVMMPRPTDLNGSYDEVIGWVDRWRAALEEALAPDALSIVAGIGRSPEGPITHAAALREATRAADIAASLPNGAPTLHFARLGALRLIFHLAGHPELEAFERDVLGPLEAYDRSRRAEFVQTLDAFLRAGGNHMRAARHLHVHRNTLIYRLERIQELLGGADLEDPEVRLNLQLALKIRSALGAVA
ncbi:MAG: helix-turn-helix domain-containing protein [Chloroflexi bacterium]|nr:helix-turn-helix domain-containing protein [Chloroflexota bacterium]